MHVCDSGWDNLEKLFLAALDQGDIETADVCSFLSRKGALLNPNPFALRSNVSNSSSIASLALLAPTFYKGFGWRQQSRWTSPSSSTMNC